MSAALNEEHVGSDLVPQVDVLVPKKPIKEYVEFGTISAKGSPDYVFQLNHLRSLIQHETELIGKEFPLPGFNFTAQIECAVEYDNFRLSIRFLNPEKIGQPIEMGIQLMNLVTIIKNQKQIDSDVELVREFPFQSQLVYGTSVPFCTLSYVENLKDAYDQLENSITLHLHVRLVATEDVFLDDGVLLWKVDVVRPQISPHFGPNKVKELGLTPFLHVAPDGLRVQIRLYAHSNGNCWIQLRNVNKSQSEIENAIDINVIHPTDPSRLPLNSTFNLGNGTYLLSGQFPYSKEMARRPRFCCEQLLAIKSELDEYVSDGKLLVKVEIYG